MSKKIKLSNETYLDSSSVIHDDTNLKTYLNSEIIKTGSNSNGFYEKYSNGILKCYKYVTVNLTFNAWSNWYDAEGSLGNWPYVFKDKPFYIQAMQGGTAVGGLIETVSNVTATSAGNVWITRPNKIDGNYYVYVMGIGYWK